MTSEEKYQKYDLIMLNMSDYNDWDRNGIVNRNFFILQQLLKNKQIGRILAVDFLPHNYKRAIKSFITGNKYNNRYKKIKRGFLGNIFKVADNLYIYHTEESICTTWENKLYDKINQAALELNFKNIILWSYLPTFTSYFDKINSKLKIFDTVDNWSAHGSYQNIKEKILDNYIIIDEKADIIFTVSQTVKKLFKNNKNVHWIPNGVDAQHFSNQEKGIVPTDIQAIKKPIIGYVGIVQNRFDIKLLEYLLKNNQNKSFVIIGMVWPESGMDKLSGYKNLYLLGQKKYQDLPKYVRQFDIAIIPHKINEFTQSMNPMKLYEYMAAGKPIVATPVEGTGQFQEVIKIANTHEDFHEEINSILKINHTEMTSKSKNIAQSNSWSNRVSQMMQIINNY